MNYEAVHIQAAAAAVHRLDLSAPEYIRVRMEGNTEDGIDIVVANLVSDDKFTVPLRSDLPCALTSVREALLFLKGDRGTPPDGARLDRGVPWYKTYTPSKYDRVRIAAQAAAYAEKTLRDVIPAPSVATQVSPHGYVTVSVFGESVEIPKELVDEQTILAADAWLRSDDDEAREYETKDFVPDAPRHYRDGYKGVPKLDI